MTSKHLAGVERWAAGLSMMCMPILLLAGFVLHPRFWSLDLTRDASTLVANFRHQWGFHLGHLLVMAAVPLILVTTIRFRTLLHRRGAALGVWGGMIAGFGAVMLAIDKGSLTLVLTGFDTLSDADLARITPALQIIADRTGWLMLTWLIVLLPVGAALQVWGLRREGYLGRWQAVTTIIGLLLLLNPDIEIIGAVGALLMCVGYLPLGWRELHRRYMPAFTSETVNTPSRIAPSAVHSG